MKRSPVPALAFVRALRRAFSFLFLVAPVAVFAAFGVTDNGTAFVVDSGAGLVLQVRKSDGTITSIVYNGVEYNGPSGKGSHIASGLGSPTTVTSQTDGSTYVKLTLQTGASNGTVASLTQYLVVRNGENTLYLATFPTAEPSVGELRWITRLKYDLLPNGPKPSDNSGSNGNIESTDVFGHADGTTTSKYYGDSVTHGKERAMDLTYDGATGTNVGAWMIFGNRESSSGGPFFRDIQNQSGAGGDQEIYNYMNSGHNQTEANRLNVLHGPYALVFNNGAAPTFPLDFSWMGSLGLTGWVPAAGRGAVSGTASGIPAGFQGVVGLANASAQYWAVINPADGSYTVPGVKPGSYTATLYKGELEVATTTVNVGAGATTPLDLASAEPSPSVIFRIGEWDGTPSGFLNAQNIVQMHPSDARNASWGPVTYNVGLDSPASFPAIQFRGANSPSTIRFNLTANQITDLTVRIGITSAYINARPVVGVNAFTSAVPAQSTQPNSRSVTIGTYRGNNALFTYTIPASALVVGTNTMTVSPATGSSDAGTWLSANFAYDAIEVDGPVATPTITYVGGNPLVISGTSEANRNIAVTLDGATPAGSTVASASGAWSVTYGGALASGAHNFTAVASDNAGHSSPASAPFAIDASVAMPAITFAVGDTGTYANSATTSDRAFVFNGNAAAGDNVTLTRVGTGNIGTVIADGGGHWTFDYTTVSLPDGANSFYATAAHGGGNGASSSVFTLNLSGQPRVAIARFNPTTSTIPTGLPRVVYRVTFNHAVSGVTTNAFALTATGSATGTISSVSAASGTVFDVTVTNPSGTGSLRLDLLPNSGVVDGGNNPEAGYTAGQTYTLVVATTGNGQWIRATSGGLWSDPANWQNAVIADGSGSSANFATLDITTNNTVHLDSPRTSGSLSFSDSVTASPASWIVDSNGSAGNTLTLAGGTPTIAVNALGAGATATLNTSLAGSSGFTKTGAGVLVLASSNTLTGNTTVSAGTLRIASGGSLAAGNVSVAVGGAQLNLAGGTFSSSGTFTVNAGSGSALVVDSGTATFNALATSNTAGGLLRINGGTVTAASVTIPRSSDATPSFAAGFIVTGGNTTVTGPVGLGTVNSWGSMSVEGGALTVNGPLTLGNQASGGRGGQMRVINNATFVASDTALGILMGRNNGANANNVATATFTGGTSFVEKFTLGFDSTVTAGSATITVNGGALYLGSGGIVKNGAAGLATTVSLASGTLGAKANWSTSVPLTLATNGNINVHAADAGDNAFDIAFHGVVGGSGALTKTGDGTLTLDGAVTHTYTGVTNVNEGALRVTGTLGAAANGVNVNSGGTLTGNGAINRAITLNSGGTLAPDAATPLATLNGASLTWNGDGVLAFDLDANGSSDALALNGALNQGGAGSYTFAFAPGANLAAGNTYTLVTFASTTFTDASAFSATGLPAGLGALFQLRDTSLQVRIQHRPNINGAASAAGVFGSPFAFTATADDMPVTFAASNLPPGLTLDAATGIISGIPAAAGTFPVTLTASNTAGAGDPFTLTITIAKAVAPVATVGAPGGNGTVTHGYDGTPKTATISTQPPGLNATFTYNGSSTPPTLPGTYDVVAAIDDPNFQGTATGKLVITITALVRHAPTLNGDIDGSAQVLLGESAALNGGAGISGDILVPGTPNVVLNGAPTYGGTQDATGAATPANYTITLNSHALLRHVVRRVEPIPMPTVGAPPASTGTRDVVLNNSNQTAGDFATVRNLTVSGNAGTVAVPPGTYGAFTANSGGHFALGIVGATEPAVYNLQSLTLNNGATLEIVGPVVLTVANGFAVNGGTVGSADHPDWLALQIASGGVTLNSSSALRAIVTAPAGAVTVNSGTLTGRVSADRLTINANGVLLDVAP